MGYKVTSDIDTQKTLMSVNAVSEFGSRILQLFGEIRPRKIIETGTFLGTGTTAIIGAALRYHKIERAEFYSIEVNRQYFERAHSNVQQQRINVQLLHGLSVPRSLLPSVEQIQKDFVDQKIDGIYVDWNEAQRAVAYHQETDHAVADDLLGRCLERFQYAPDFLLLDSAGHLGYIEFRYAIEKVRARCHLALDDTNHVKHYRSVQEMKADPRFKILHESPEKFGFCIAEFDPSRR